MQIPFYDVRIAKNNKVMLLKEKAVDYKAENMNHPEKMAEMMRELIHMDELAEEHCYMVAMDCKCRILGMFFISKGTVNASLVGMREIFMRALLVGASCIVVCHNHPSKDTTPSSGDMVVTRKMKEAGKLLGVELVDHIIIGGNEYCSFKENDYMD